MSESVWSEEGCLLIMMAVGRKKEKKKIGFLSYVCSFNEWILRKLLKSSNPSNGNV